VIRFKTDENLHPETADLLRSAGHDALTVWDQSLRGRPDADIAAICRAEGRALVTLNLDCADIRKYPPEQYGGIVVLRVAALRC
jgi:predicted nuclease of predicted toxin-antitoxin system